MPEANREKEQFKEALRELEHSLQHARKIKKDRIYFQGISKSFEVCLEYAWKYLKQALIEEGIEVGSPKDTFRHAGRLGWIDKVERWFHFIDIRNLAVHDYLEMEDDAYLNVIREFFREAKKLYR